MSEFNLKSGNATPFKMMGSSPAKQTEEKEPTKRSMKHTTSGAYGSSGGYETREFVKGGRKGDKTTKVVEYTKDEPTTEKYRGEGESDKPTYTKTKTRVTRKGETKTKTKKISAKKYEKQTRRRHARAIRRGHDIETREA